MKNDFEYLSWLGEAIRGLSQNLRGYLQEEGVMLWTNELSSFKKAHVEKAFEKFNKEYDRMPKLKKVLFECNQVKHSAEGVRHVADSLTHDQKQEYRSYKHGDRVRIKHHFRNQTRVMPTATIYDGVVLEDQQAFKVIKFTGIFKFGNVEKEYDFYMFLHEIISDNRHLERLEGRETFAPEASAEDIERFKRAVAKGPRKEKAEPALIVEPVEEKKRG